MLFLSGSHNAAWPHIDATTLTMWIPDEKGHYGPLPLEMPVSFYEAYEEAKKQIRFIFTTFVLFIISLRDVVSICNKFLQRQTTSHCDNFLHWDDQKCNANLRQYESNMFDKDV